MPNIELLAIEVKFCVQSLEAQKPSSMSLSLSLSLRLRKSPRAEPMDNITIYYRILR
jgi:hypothetical protein